MHSRISEDFITHYLEIGRKLLDGVSYNQLYIDDLMDQSNSLLFWKKNNSEYLGCNKRVAILSGIMDPQSIVGKYDYDLVWQKESEIYCKDDQEVVNHVNTKLNIEEPMHLCDGKNIILLTSKFKIYSSDRKKTGIVGIATDITEHKFLEKKLLTIANSELENANQLQNNFFKGFIEAIHRLDNIVTYLNNQKKKFSFFYGNKKISLSSRQLQCIILILQRKTNKQIAKVLHLSPRTIEDYLITIKQKFDCTERHQLLNRVLSMCEFIDPSQSN